MKKLLLMLTVVIGFTSVFAQNVSSKHILQNRIAHRDAIMSKIAKKGLPDSLKAQIDDYRQLTVIFMEEANSCTEDNDNLRKELHKFHVLTTADTLIFNHDLNSLGEIPICLRERVDIVKAIIELRTRISATEYIADELEKKLSNSSIAHAAIREKIDKELDAIQSLIHKIKGMNLSTLSDDQQKYFRPGLTNRYNNFKKYF